MGRRAEDQHYYFISLVDLLVEGVFFPRVTVRRCIQEGQHDAFQVDAAETDKGSEYVNETDYLERGKSGYAGTASPFYFILRSTHSWDIK